MKPRFFLPLLTLPQVCTEGFLSRAISLARHQRAVLHAVVFDVVQPLEHASRDDGDVMRIDHGDSRHSIERLLRAAELQACSNGVELVTDWLAIDAGNASRVVAETARGHDLILLESSRCNSTLYAVSEALVAHSRLPCLVLPPGPFSGHFNRVVIAWDGSDSADKATTAANAFIQQAVDVTVAVIAGERQRPENQMLRVVELLRSRGSTVESLVVPGKDGGENLQLNALKIGGNLLVMGGFGHSGLRESLFGGTPADIICNTLMPVFLAH